MKKYLLSGIVALSCAGTFISPVLAQTASNAPAIVTAQCPSIGLDLKLGDKNGDVTALQEWLQTLGFLSSTPTGYYGPKTAQAVKRFQQAHGLPATGYFGPKSRAWCNSTQGTPLVGNDRDTHGCIASAGYVWSSTTQGCIRPWEKNGPATSTQNVLPVITSISPNDVTLDLVSNAKTVARGNTITFTATLRNVSSSTITFASGSSGCPSDIILKINMIDFYTFVGRSGRACTMDYGYVTLNPGQTRTLSFADVVPDSIPTGDYLAEAIFTPISSTTKAAITTITIQ